MFMIVKTLEREESRTGNTDHKILGVGPLSTKSCVFVCLMGLFVICFLCLLMDVSVICISLSVSVFICLFLTVLCLLLFALFDIFRSEFNVKTVSI